MQLLSKNCIMALQCIPTQCGVPGNEHTDPLAKQGSQTEQPGANVSYQEKVTITKAFMMPSQEKGANHLLSRPEHVITVRLRTGDNQWNTHMHKQLKIPSAACPCGEEYQTNEHVLQNCERHDQERSAA